MNNKYLTTHNPQPTTKKTVAIITAISILLQTIAPTVTYALTGGPASPEFSKFESVSTGQMVDPFTGDFTYNLPILEIPGPNGGGYPISLSYHSGSSPEEEASWVGYGWTLNPGAISRSKQAYPDDANGDNAIFLNKIGTNNTIMGGLEAYLKLFNIPGIKGLAEAALNADAKLGVNWQLAYNNRMGLSMQFVPYMNAGVGFVSASVSLDDGEIRPSASINPGAWISGMIMAGIDPNYGGKGTLATLGRFASSTMADAVNSTANSFSSNPSTNPFGNKAYTLYNNSAPTVLQNYVGYGVNARLGAWVNPTPVPIGWGAAIFGSASWQDPENDGVSQKPYYGYLYTSNVGTDLDALQDYTVEKQDLYNLRDNYLPIPYSAADMYNVTAEGLGGTFRAYSNNIGHFRPNQQHSSTSTYAGSLEVGMGLTNTVTIALAMSQDVETTDEPANDALEAIVGGGHVLSVDEWYGIRDCAFPESTENDAYYFRMIGDMGGYSEHNNAYSTVLTARLEGHYPVYGSGIKKAVNDGDEVTRATFIGYHTNSEMQNEYNRYSYRDDTKLASDFSRPSGDGIGEFAITNQAGAQYVYALPVYANNEGELSVDVGRNDDIENKTIVYKDVTSYMTAVKGIVNNIDNLMDGVTANDDDITDDIDINDTQKLVGAIKNESYATAHLLTQITQPNYIDVTNNGPTADDIGGWTKFNYTKLSDSYHWRIPYNGMFYSPGNLSDLEDDMGNFRFGDKDVYYLESIETATHIAIFETSNRADGIQAPDEYTDYAGMKDSMPTSKKALQKLDKITLYAKDADGNPDKVIKRTYFEYDYSCFPGIPNFDADLDVGYATTDGTGKLTLKKVWMENGEVNNATISPFEFSYTYPTTHNPLLTTDVDYPEKPKYEKQDTDKDGDIDDDDKWVETETDEYADLENYGNGLNEAPEYTAYCSDRWGSYRSNGDDLANELFAWVDQTPDVDFDGNAIASGEKFDPAAWKLKQIKLPTGAEIHVQYEQDDYCYVQNRKAMAMIPLDNTNNTDTTCGTKDANKIYLDLSVIGIQDDADAIKDMQEWIQKELVDKSQKAYFNFLYSMNTSNAGLNNCNSAYVSGYITLNAVGADDLDVDGKATNLYVKLGAAIDGESDWEFPYDACIEFYKTTNGNLNYDFDCNEKEELIDFSSFSTGDIPNPEAIGEGIYELTDHLVNSVSGDYTSVCTNIKLNHSYIRLPLPYEKKGGGLRVKRLLTYDPGLEDNDNMVYGHEYQYIGYDRLSSGVAANEPLEGGEENALINFMNKREGSSFDQIMASGPDKSQFQGPLGVNILPGPAVGYSRVVVRNIHSASTHDGISTHEFYTTKDYPFDKKYSYTDADGKKRKYNGVNYTNLDPVLDDDNSFYAVLYTQNELNAYALQGYKFILNGMNGQLKKQSQFSGKWENYNNPDSLQEISSIRYNYNEPGVPVVALNYDGSTSTIIPGKTSEIIAESKKISDETGTVTLSVEIGFSMGGPVPIPWVIPIPVKVSDQTHIYTHVTTQIDYYPPIVNSITKYQDGTYSTVNNLYYDKLSGNPIVTSAAGIHDKMEYSRNGTDTLIHYGTYFSYNQPGTFYYEGMGQKAGSERFCFDTADDEYSGISFERESMAVIIDGETSYSHKLKIGGSEYTDVLNKFCMGDLLAIQYNSNDPEICNVTDISGSTLTIKGAEGFGFVDASSGSWSPTKVTILKSGKTNMLLLNAGNVVSYGETFSSTSKNNIISASANTFDNTFDIDENVEIAYGVNESNKVESGEAGKWVLDASYIYKTDLETSKLSFKSGLFSDFEYFDYDAPSSVSEKWLQTSTPTMYAPDGNLLEEKNILDIYSTSKFGYNNTLPYLVASNAQYGDVFFESFENDQLDNCATGLLCFEGLSIESKSALSYSSSEAHSGSKSLLLTSSSFTEMELRNNDETVECVDWSNMIDDGISIKLWCKPGSVDINKIKITGLSMPTVLFTLVAQTGEWQLYQAIINPEDWSSGSTGECVYPDLYFDFNGTIYIDDIRIQPLDAQMVTYVYDPATYQLLTSFDDQHFGLYYQYNEQGQLIRKQKETERGLKTIVETQYNIPSISRE